MSIVHSKTHLVHKTLLVGKRQLIGEGRKRTKLDIRTFGAKPASPSSGWLPARARPLTRENGAAGRRDSPGPTAGVGAAGVGSARHHLEEVNIRGW